LLRLCGRCDGFSFDDEGNIECSIDDGYADLGYGPDDGGDNQGSWLHEYEADQADQDEEDEEDENGEIG
jgi:hypothetical protein